MRNHAEAAATPAEHVPEGTAELVPVGRDLIGSHGRRSTTAAVVAIPLRMQNRDIRAQHVRCVTGATSVHILGIQTYVRPESGWPNLWLGN